MGEASDSDDTDNEMILGEDTGIKGTSDIANRDTLSKQEKGLHPLDIDAHWLQVTSFHLECVCV